jgi:hypothetical protein
MLYCEKCDTFWDDEDSDIHERLQVQRDGDTYDPSTNFWYVCPFCQGTLIEKNTDGEFK